MRGNVARTHTNKVARASVLIIKNMFVNTGMYPINRTDVINLIIKILVYSAIKINANIAPPYSTLNPETSSDSPSAKSKGVRFVSARFVMNHITEIGNISAIGHDKNIDDIRDKSIVRRIINTESIINDIDTSYDTV